MTRRLQRSLQLLAVAAIATTANAAAAKQPAVTWLVFVDDLHLDFVNTGRIRTLVRTMLNELPTDGDTVAMRSCAGSGVSVLPTTDRARLYGETNKLTGGGLRPDDLKADAANGGREVRLRAAAAQACLREFIATAGDDDQDRRVAILYISNGYGSGVPPDLGATRSPTIFTLDARLFEGPSSLDAITWPDYWAATRNSLRLLAVPSGGFVLEENQSVSDALKRIGATMRQR